MEDHEFRKGGYIDRGLNKNYVELVHSRTTAPDGKVYQGEVAERLKEKYLEKQKYYERNG